MAAADATADVSADMVETVVVSGFRKSLQEARELKRNADSVGDAIVAADIAKFPELNLAESLQRLPGVTINREAGEGRRIALRGLGSDFTRVQLNGMEVLGNVDSPMDSRGQTSRDRAFDFNIFASELFSRIDIRKSFAAEQNEGGLAGTVGLFTAKPFDFSGIQGGVSLQGGTNTLTTDAQPRGAGMLSYNWNDKLGLLVSVAYSSRQTEEQGTNTYRFRKVAAGGANISALSTTDKTLITSKQLAFARGNRLTVWDSDQKRLGITAALQWKPVENLIFTLDGVYGELGNHRQEHSLATRAAQGSTILGGTFQAGGITYAAPTLNEIRYDKNYTVLYTDVDNTVFASESRRQITKNVFKQAVLSGDWQVTNKLQISGHAGIENSTYNMPVSDKIYLAAVGGLISDYTKSAFHLHNTYKWDTTDPDNYAAQEIQYNATYQKTKFSNAELNSIYTFDDDFTLKAGYSFREFENSGYTQESGSLYKTALATGTMDASVSDYYYVFKNHEDHDWIAVNWNKAMAHYGLTRTLGDPESVYTVKETTSAGYLQLDWKLMLGDFPLHGNAGLRAYRTDVTSTGEANIGIITAKNSYDGLLPTFNATLDLTETTLLRLAYAKNINRPSLSSMSIAGTVSYDTSTKDLTINIGNPDLKPYTSSNVDLALERYFGDVGLVAFGAFYKHINGFIGSETSSNVAFAKTGLPDSVLTSLGISTDTTVTSLTRPVNFESTDLAGVELSGQSDFTFLPAPFDKFGILGNLTLLHSKLDYASPSDQASGTHKYLSLEGLSSVNGNATLYYEADDWGLRGSANYRSGYVYSGAGATEETHSGFNATIYVDASAYYKLTDKIRFSLDAINLLNTREEEYSDKSHRLYNATTSGTTIYFGLKMEL